MFTDAETVEREISTDLAAKNSASSGGEGKEYDYGQEDGAVGYIHLCPVMNDLFTKGLYTYLGTPTP